MTTRMNLTEQERAALLMLHYAANGAATAMCGGSHVLAAVNAALGSLVQGDTDGAVRVMRDLHALSRPA